ncbi:TPA: hypothetical protein ACGO8N_001952 [Streptococcus suis]
MVYRHLVDFYYFNDRGNVVSLFPTSNTPLDCLNSPCLILQKRLAPQVLSPTLDSSLTVQAVWGIRIVRWSETVWGTVSA